MYANLFSHQNAKQCLRITVLYHQQFTNIAEVVQVWKLSPGQERNEANLSKFSTPQNRELDQTFYLTVLRVTKG